MSGAERGKESDSPSGKAGEPAVAGPKDPGSAQPRLRPAKKTAVPGTSGQQVRSHKSLGLPATEQPAFTTGEALPDFLTSEPVPEYSTSGTIPAPEPLDVTEVAEAPEPLMPAVPAPEPAPAEPVAGPAPAPGAAHRAPAPTGAAPAAARPPLPHAGAPRPPHPPTGTIMELVWPEVTGGIRGLQLVSLVLIGLLTSLSCWLSPPISDQVARLLGSTDYALATGPVAVLVGLLYAFMVGFLFPRGWPPGDPVHRHLLVLAGVLAVVIGTFAYSITAGIAFFAAQALLFPGSIMAFGVGRGRRWAVVAGMLLQLGVSLTNPVDPSSLGLLLGFAVVLAAAAELSFSTAGLINILERELQESTTPAQKRLARGVIDHGVRSYIPRALVVLGAGVLLVGTGTMLYLKPSVFGPAFGESIEATSVISFLLPLLLIMLVTLLLLAIPDNAGDSLRKAGRGARNWLYLFGGYVKRKLRGAPTEDEDRPGSPMAVDWDAEA